MARQLALVRDDAVLRKKRFQELHPEISIRFRSLPVWHWEATLPSGQEITDHELSGLLDQLDELDLREA